MSKWKIIVITMFLVCLAVAIGLGVHYRESIKGWFNFSSEKPIEPVKPPNSVNIYAVKFKAGNQEFVKYIEAGEYVSAPTISIESYSFEGWLLNGERVDLSTLQINSDIEFIADLLKICKVSFHIGTEIIDNFVKIGEVCEVPIVSNVGDSKFVYWSLSYEGGDPVDPIDYMLNDMTEDITFYAQFTDVLSGKLLDFSILNGEITGYGGTGEYISFPSSYSIENGLFIEGNDYQITGIAANAFKGNKTIKSVNFSSNILKVGASAFAGCINLEGITMSDNLEEIGERAFYGCSNLRRVLHFSNKLTKINDFTFGDCSSLIELQLPDSVIEIGDCAFELCSNLTSIVLPSSLVRLGKMVFIACENLKSIIIPDSVIEIGSGCFSQIQNLVVNMYSDVPPVVENGNLGSSSLKVIVPDELFDAYVAAGWSCQILKKSEV